MFAPLLLWVLWRERPAVSVHAGVSEDQSTPGAEHVRPFVMMDMRLKFVFGQSGINNTLPPATLSILQSAIGAGRQTSAVHQPQAH